jgi:hypothetical protein
MCVALYVCVCLWAGAYLEGRIDHVHNQLDARFAVDAIHLQTGDADTKTDLSEKKWLHLDIESDSVELMRFPLPLGLSVTNLVKDDAVWALICRQRLRLHGLKLRHTEQMTSLQ